MMGKGVVVGGVWVLSLMLCGCNVAEPPPFDPRMIQRPERARSEAVAGSRLYPLPGELSYPFPASQPADATRPTSQPGPPATGPSLLPRQIVRIPIREIMQRAAANSHEVRVAGYDPAIAGSRVVENEAHYDPIFITNVRYDKQNDNTAGTVIPNPVNPTMGNILITVENNNIYTIETGVKQNLPNGGQIQVSYQLTQSDYSPVRFVRNNYWDNQLKVQLTQPILRDFGVEVNYARITIGRNDQRVSMLDFRKALEDNTNELEKDYWNLWEAQQEVTVQEQLLVRTRELAQVLYTQFIVGGAATHVEASQGSAAVRQRETTLGRTKAHVQDISDDIKRRMNDPNLPVAGPEVILPADQPVTEAVEFDEHDQIETAMDNRLELGQQQIRINSAEIARRVALNGLYPKLDLVANYALQGLSGTIGSGLNDQFSGGHSVYSLGFQLEIPLGNREARAILTRAELQRLQAVESYRNAVAQVSQDVASAVREVRTTWNEMRGNRQTRFLQEDALVGLIQRRTNGAIPTTPESVQVELDAQERLAEAQRQEALAIANYNIALARLEKAKGTLLRYNNIVMEQDRLPWNSPEMLRAAR